MALVFRGVTPYFSNSTSFKFSSASTGDLGMVMVTSEKYRSADSTNHTDTQVVQEPITINNQSVTPSAVAFHSDSDTTQTSRRRESVVWIYFYDNVSSSISIVIPAGLGTTHAIATSFGGDIPTKAQVEAAQDFAASESSNTGVYGQTLSTSRMSDSTGSANWNATVFPYGSILILAAHHRDGSENQTSLGASWSGPPEGDTITTFETNANSHSSLISIDETSETTGSLATRSATYVQSGTDNGDKGHTAALLFGIPLTVATGTDRERDTTDSTLGFEDTTSGSQGFNRQATPLVNMLFLGDAVEPLHGNANEKTPLVNPVYITTDEAVATLGKYVADNFDLSDSADSQRGQTATVPVDEMGMAASAEPLHGDASSATVPVDEIGMTALAEPTVNVVTSTTDSLGMAVIAEELHGQAETASATTGISVATTDTILSGHGQSAVALDAVTLEDSASDDKSGHSATIVDGYSLSVEADKDASVALQYERNATDESTLLDSALGSKEYDREATDASMGLLDNADANLGAEMQGSVSVSLQDIIDELLGDFREAVVDPDDGFVTSEDLVSSGAGRSRDLTEELSLDDSVVLGHGDTTEAGIVSVTTEDVAVAQAFFVQDVQEGLSLESSTLDSLQETAEVLTSLGLNDFSSGIAAITQDTQDGLGLEVEVIDEATNVDNGEKLTSEAFVYVDVLFGLYGYVTDVLSTTGTVSVSISYDLNSTDGLEPNTESGNIQVNCFDNVVFVDTTAVPVRPITLPCVAEGGIVGIDLGVLIEVGGGTGAGGGAGDGGFGGVHVIPEDIIINIPGDVSIGGANLDADSEVVIPGDGDVDGTLNALWLDNEVIIQGKGSVSPDFLTNGELMSVEEVWNTALTQLGVTTIGSTSDQSPQATLLNGVWNGGFRTKFLADHTWNGGKRTAELAKYVDNPTGGRWNYAFTLPSDYIRALRVNGKQNVPDSYNAASSGGSGGRNIWEIEVVANDSGTLARCLLTGEQAVALEYMFDVGDVNIDLLAPMTRWAMGLALAAHAAPNFGKSTSDIQMLEAKAQDAIVAAKGVDGQEGTSQMFQSTSLLDCRY